MCSDYNLLILATEHTFSKKRREKGFVLQAFFPLKLSIEIESVVMMSRSQTLAFL